MADQLTPNRLESIPQPPGKFILGNLPDIMGDAPILDLMEMARKQGPIYQLTVPGRPSLTVVSGFELVDELCDDSRTADMTRLTLDTIGLCGFDYRFNSFYRDTLHPFVQAMMDNLEENQERQRRLPLQDRLMIRKQRQRQASSITVGVVRGPARSGHGIFEGVSSTYLSQREAGDMVYAFVQDTKSRFRLPENPATPMIMIGPGTGMAPFRGFLQERAALKVQGKEVGKSLLYFGCRHPEQDFIYEDELQAFADQGVTDLSVAFSRLDGKKIYVQDKIKEDQEKVWQLLQKGAIVYICGDASKMAPDVRKAFADIYQAKMGASEQEANQWLDALTAQNRYLVDVWGI